MFIVLIDLLRLSRLVWRMDKCVIFAGKINNKMQNEINSKWGNGSGSNNSVVYHIQLYQY